MATLPSFTAEEVARHRTATDCWCIIGGFVYDLTDWIDDHPGGGKIVLAQGGKDATELFTSFHSEDVLPDVAEAFKIGTLAAAEATAVAPKLPKAVGGGVYANSEVNKAPQTLQNAARTGAAAIGALQTGGAQLVSKEGGPHIDVTISADELSLIKNTFELEELAIERLPDPAAMFIEYGAEDETSKRANLAAWGRYALRPRVALDRNITRVDMSTTVMGRRVSLPVLMGAAGGHGIANHRAEIATARGAAATGTVGGIAQRAHFPLSEIYREAVAAQQESGQAEDPFLMWQLYVPKLKGADEMDREYCEKAIKYASDCGFQALCVTVDTPVPGNREMTYNNPAWSKGMQEEVGGFPSIHSLDEVDVGENLPGGHCGALTWDDIAWMAALTPMKMIVKGIMTGEDAAIAATTAGVDGIVVSNHGGRQIDGALGSAEVLEECVAAVGGRCEVFVDGGVRRGKDVLRALALGATAVFVGRPVFWGLALGGQAGLERLVEMFRDELTICMQLCGCPTIGDITRAHVHDRGEQSVVPVVAAMAAKDREIAGLRQAVAQLRQLNVQASLALAKL